MNRTQLILLCVGLILHHGIHAQQPPSFLSERNAPKPFLFTSLPDQFELASAELNQVLSGDVNEKINSQLSSQFRVVGTVVDRSQHTPGSVSVNIKLENYDNALLNLTIRFLADNSATIQGRIIHPRYGDAIEIYKENGKYYAKKLLQRLYMPE